MIVGVQGTKTFSSYPIYMRSMAVAMSMMDDNDKELFVYTAGPANINNYVAEFSNVTENSLKARGITIRFFRVPPQWILDNTSSLDYFIYLSRPKERLSKLAESLDEAGIEIGHFQY